MGNKIPGRKIQLLVRVLCLFDPTAYIYNLEQM